MARKNLITGFQLLDNQSLGASFTSAPTNVENLDNLTYLISTAGITDNTGQFYVQGRIKKDINRYSDWNTFSFSPAIAALADGNVTFSIELYGICYTEVRLGFTAAGGTPDGTADVWVQANQVGG